MPDGPSRPAETAPPTGAPSASRAGRPAARRARSEEARRARPRRPESPADVLARCRRYLAEGTPLHALKALAEYVRNHPDDAEGHRLRAEARLAVGDRAGALEALVEALRRGARAVEPSLVRFLIDGGLFDEADAVAAARLAEGRDPARWAALRAHAALAAGRYLEAQAAIDDLDRLGQTDAPVRAADYLRVLLWTALGDARRLGGLAERIEARGAQTVHVEFVRAAGRLLEGGAVEEFLDRCETTATAILRGGRAGGAADDLAALLRSVRPDWFRPPRSAERGRLRRVLGARLPETEVSLPAGRSLATEDADLVREVFVGATHVTLDPIDDGPSAGRSGDLVYRARPEYPGLKEHASIVKVGPKHRIALERLRIERFVVGRLHPRHYPAPRGYACSLRRAALRSTWAVPDHEEVRSLYSLYLAPPERAATERFEDLLAGLVGEVLRPWYVENADVRPAVPAEVHGLGRVPEALDRALRDLEVEAAGDRLQIDGLDVGWWPPDPRPRLEEALAAASREVPVWFGIVHGDLNLRNVLVGRGGSGDVSTVCLVDFYKTGPGPILADIARLEADLRHDADFPPEGDGPGEGALRDERAYLDEILVAAPMLDADLTADCRLSVERRFRAALALRWAAAEAAREAGAAPTRAEHLAALAARTAALLGYETLGRTRRLIALAALARTIDALAAIA